MTGHIINDLQGFTRYIEKGDNIAGFMAMKTEAVMLVRSMYQLNLAYDLVKTTTKASCCLNNIACLILV